MTDLNRRSFLTRGALLAGATVMGPAAFSALTARSAGAAVGTAAGGSYGALARARAVNEPAGPEYLALPAGFSYVVFGKIGSLMKDGNPTPVNLDGMAAFEGPRGGVRLIRNHEDRNPSGTLLNGAAPAARSLRQSSRTRSARRARWFNSLVRWLTRP